MEAMHKGFSEYFILRSQYKKVQLQLNMADDNAGVVYSVSFQLPDDLL